MCCLVILLMWLSRFPLQNNSPSMLKLKIKYNIINTSEEKLNLTQQHKGINCPDSTKQHRKQHCEVRTDSGQNKTETHSNKQRKYDRTAIHSYSFVPEFHLVFILKWQSLNFLSRFVTIDRAALSSRIPWMCARPLLSRFLFPARAPKSQLKRRSRDAVIKEVFGFRVHQVRVVRA